MHLYLFSGSGTRVVYIWFSEAKAGDDIFVLWEAENLFFEFWICRKYSLRNSVPERA